MQPTEIRQTIQQRYGAFAEMGGNQETC